MLHTCLVAQEWGGNSHVAATSASESPLGTTPEKKRIERSLSLALLNNRGQLGRLDERKGKVWKSFVCHIRSPKL